MSRRRALVAAAVLATVGALGVHALLGFPATGVDDADITLVYARHLLEGEGLVFVRGGERVEGFTSPAWMLLSAAAWLTPAPELALRIVSTALCAGVLAAVLTLARLLGGASWLALGVTVAWLAGLPRFYAWGTATLMETPLWAVGIHALALVLGFAAAERLATSHAVRALGLLGAILVAVRPEALAIVPLAIGVAVWNAAPREGGLGAALRRYAPALAAFALAVAALTAWRLVYFGDPLPNTYYAKVSPDRLYNLREGTDYVLRFLRAQPVAAALGAMALIVFARGLALPRRPLPDEAQARRARAAFAVSALALAGLVLPLASGGDHFGSFRFLQPFVPLLVLPLVWLGTTSPAPEARLRARMGATGTLALLLVVTAPLVAASWWRFARGSGIEHEFAVAENGRRLGRLLNAYFPSELRPSVGAVVTGGLALGYDGPVRDLMGLNWRAMGHAPGDRKGERSHAAFHAPTFWTAPPELLTPKLARGRPRDGCDVAGAFERAVLRDIHRTPRFRERYTAGWFPVEGRRMIAFFLESWAREHPLPGLVLLEGAQGDCTRPPPPLGPRRSRAGG